VSGVKEREAPQHILAPPPLLNSPAGGGSCRRCCRCSLRELKLLRHLGGHENISWILDIMVAPPVRSAFRDVYIVTVRGIMMRGAVETGRACMRVLGAAAVARLARHA